ncbi:MAG: RagB/SusD family nutrient uptake outer membrane protein, partial [Chitinophagaceae bacterium]|nr:RagB/SusD family nutrient uptake outer membrane protein [Chitinophagaceae bacterium]
MKKYFSIYITILAVMFAASCKKFIDEKQVSILTNDYYNTEQGVEDLVKSAYERTRFKFEYEQAYALWNFGVDEFTVGDQFNFEWFNKYDSRLNPAGGTGETYLSDLWSANYDGINRCNLGLERIPVVPGVRLLATADQRKQRMAELRFLRGFYYFQLVQQFGGLPITTTSSEGIRTEFARSSVADTYLQIIGDLKMAADSLNPTTTEFGRATKAAAMHFLAKAYLTRGSAVAEQRGQKPTDMDSAAYYAEQVITGVAGGGYVLATDYKDLWRGVYPEDNPTWILPTLGNSGVAPVAPNTSAYTTSINAQKNKEILFSAQWNNKPALTGRFGNQTHMYFGCAYENSPSEVGVTRDVHGGRPFRRLQPTDYAMDIYDRKNDSRFYKEFRIAHYSNVNQTSARFTAANAPDPSFVGKTRFGIG